MQCSKCGTTNENGAEFCQKCGMAFDRALEIETTISLSPIEVEEECREIEIAPAEGPILVVTKGPFIGQKFNLAKNETTLGRDPNSDIFLDDVTVSRNHAKITMGDDSVTVIDADSLNGTYVNQQCIDGPTELESDDELQIGKFKLVFLAKK